MSLSSHLRALEAVEVRVDCISELVVEECAGSRKGSHLGQCVTLHGSVDSLYKVCNFIFIWQRGNDLSYTTGWRPGSGDGVASRYSCVLLFALTIAHCGELALSLGAGCSWLECVLLIASVDEPIGQSFYT